MDIATIYFRAICGGFYSNTQRYRISLTSLARAHIDPRLSGRLGGNAR